MHELTTQEWINKDSVFEWKLSIVSILVFIMPNLIQPREMQVQTNHDKVTVKEVTVENGQLAHKTWPLPS